MRIPIPSHTSHRFRILHWYIHVFWVKCKNQIINLIQLFLSAWRMGPACIYNATSLQLYRITSLLLKHVKNFNMCFN